MHNFLFKAEGPSQSSDRAELRCLLRVIRWAPTITEYLTDNMAVKIGYEKLLAGVKTWKVWKQHNDLWAYVKMAVDAKSPNFVIVSYVKGYAKEIHLFVCLPSIPCPWRH